jgi:hypothetical protein
MTELIASSPVNCSSKFDTSKTFVLNSGLNGGGYYAIKIITYMFLNHFFCFVFCKERVFKYFFNTILSS